MQTCDQREGSLDVEKTKVNLQNHKNLPGARIEMCTATSADVSMALRLREERR